MSSDLLAAFGGPDNQSTSIPQPVSGSTPTKYVGNAEILREAAGDTWGSELISHDNQPSQTFPVRKASQGDSHSDTDSWSAVNEEIQNAWFNNGPDGKSYNKQPHNRHLDTTAIIQVVATGELEDDEFGDFETTLEESIQQRNEVERPKPSATPLASQKFEPGADTGDHTDEWGDFEDVQATSSYPVQVFKHETSDWEALELVEHPIKAETKINDVHKVRHIAPTYDPFAGLDSWACSKESRINALESIPGQAKQPVPSFDNATPLVEVQAIIEDLDEEWDDFSSLPENKEIAQNGDLDKSATPNKAYIKPMEPTNTSQYNMKPSLDTLPPTNVPPPSILLSLLSRTILNFPAEIESIPRLAKEFPEDEVQFYISVLRSTARICAGRKLRWKRDTHLSQSMSIGIAGQTKGMKLASVDKAEVQREDREAAELTRIWQQTSGSIRTSVIKASIQISAKPPSLPSISEQSVIRCLRPADGGIKAPRCCVFCGIKRDERLDKVDVEVWDQFGEWWTAHWGHRDCQILWGRYEEDLRQR